MPTIRGRRVRVGGFGWNAVAVEVVMAVVVVGSQSMRFSVQVVRVVSVVADLVSSLSGSVGTVLKLEFLRSFWRGSREPIEKDCVWGWVGVKRSSIVEPPSGAVISGRGLLNG